MLIILFIFLLNLFFKTNLAYQYDPILTQVSINISQATYCLPFLKTYDCYTCDQFSIYESTSLINGEFSVFGYNMLYDSVFVGFRGSSNLENWLSSVRFLKVYPYSDNIGIEKGFYNNYLNNKENIIENIQTLTQKYNTNNLIITGHSLGGALATILSFDLIYNNYSYDILLTTFGSPRVGNKEFVKYFEKLNLYSKRITHYYDIVPHVPQAKLGYMHISQEIWYDQPSSDYLECNDYLEEDKSCSDSCAPLKCISTDDHLKYLNISMGKDGLC